MTIFYSRVRKMIYSVNPVVFVAIVSFLVIPLQYALRGFLPIDFGAAFIACTVANMAVHVKLDSKQMWQDKAEFHGRFDVMINALFAALYAYLHTPMIALMLFAVLPAGQHMAKFIDWFLGIVV